MAHHISNEHRQKVLFRRDLKELMGQADSVNEIFMRLPKNDTTFVTCHEVHQLCMMLSEIQEKHVIPPPALREIIAIYDDSNPDNKIYPDGTSMIRVDKDGQHVNIEHLPSYTSIAMIEYNNQYDFTNMSHLIGRVEVFSCTNEDHISVDTKDHPLSGSSMPIDLGEFTYRLHDYVEPVTQKHMRPLCHSLQRVLKEYKRQVACLTHCQFDGQIVINDDDEPKWRPECVIPRYLKQLCKYIHGSKYSRVYPELKALNKINHAMQHHSPNVKLCKQAVPIHTICDVLCAKYNIHTLVETPSSTLTTPSTPPPTPTNGRKYLNSSPNPDQFECVCNHEGCNGYMITHTIDNEIICVVDYIDAKWGKTITIHRTQFNVTEIVNDMEQKMFEIDTIFSCLDTVKAI